MMEVSRPITVVELASFLRSADRVWSEDERSAFVDYIASNPAAGHVSPETGGLRKVRWGRPGVGKRGGVRVIYFYFSEGVPLYLITVYPKSDKEDLSTAEKRAFVSYIDELKRQFRS
jgi:hypothetical protein